ncbi:hypothetical protein LT493_07605 [Streptomyces tricolor]|nr:hypothetical protein [Streptomyces tricolor]
MVCPGCGGRALVTPRPGLPPPRYVSELLVLPRRLTCAGCGATAGWSADVRGAGLVAPSRAAPRTLSSDGRCGCRPGARAVCCGPTTWSISTRSAPTSVPWCANGAARVRRGRCSRGLPRWLKESGHRAEVLAGLERLRELARRSAPGDRSDAAYERGDRPRPYRALHFRGGPYKDGTRDM